MSWTKTKVVISGTDRVLLNDLFAEMQKLFLPNKSFSYDELIKVLKLDKSKIIASSGTVLELSQDNDGVIRLEDSIPGIDHLDLYKELAKACKGLKVIYCGYDDNDNPFITNDVDCLYFPERFVLIEQEDENEFKKSFCGFDELAAYVSATYGVTLYSPADIQGFNTTNPDARIFEIKERKTQFFY